MAFLNCPTLLLVSSWLIVTKPLSRDISTLLTPGMGSSTFFTLRTQPMQVMPLTVSVDFCNLDLLLSEMKGGPVYFWTPLPAFHLLSSSELLTTETELIAIAAPAMTGFNIPIAASGMPSTL